MGCKFKFGFIIDALQYLENCQFSRETSTNDDKILKITKEPNRVIGDSSRTSLFLLSTIDKNCKIINGIINVQVYM